MLAQAFKNQLRYLKNAFVPPSVNLQSRLASRPQTDFLAASLRDGDVFFDIGAAVGLFSLHALQSGKRIEVHSFEPHPGEAKTLHSVVGELGANIHQIAISNRSGEAIFHLHPSEARSSLAETEEYAGTRTIKVRTTTVADLVANGLPAPDIVKIDAEGYEPEIVKGMLPMLTAKKPRLVMIELENRHLRPRGHDASEVIGEMTRQGYSAHAWFGDTLRPVPSGFVFPEQKTSGEYIYDFVLRLDQ